MKHTTPEKKLKTVDRITQATEQALLMEDEGCPNPAPTVGYEAAGRGARARQLLHYRISKRAEAGIDGVHGGKEGC